MWQIYQYNLVLKCVFFMIPFISQSLQWVTSLLYRPLGHQFGLQWVIYPLGNGYTTMTITKISSHVLFQLKVTARNQTFALHLTLEPNPVQKVTYQSDTVTPEIFCFWNQNTAMESTWIHSKWRKVEHNEFPLEFICQALGLIFLWNASSCVSLIYFLSLREASLSFTEFKWFAWSYFVTDP